MRKRRGTATRLAALLALGTLTAVAVGNLPGLITDAEAVVSSGAGGSGGGSGGGGDSPGPWVRMSVEHFDRMKPAADSLNGGVWGGIDPAVCRDPSAERWAKLNASGWPVYSQNTAPNVGEIPEPLQSAARGSWVNIVCGYSNVIIASEWRYEVREGAKSNAQLRETGVHTLTTSVAPQPIRNAEGKMVLDPVGKAQLHSESSSKLTEFGKLWNSFNLDSAKPDAKTRDLVAEYKDRIAKAKTTDATAERANLSLSVANQEGLAEGGILNISEFGLHQSVNVDTQTTPYSVWRCGWVRWSQTGWQPSSANNCGRVTGSINPDALPTGGFRADTTARWANDAQRRAYTPTSPGLTAWNRYASTVAPSQQTQRQLGFWQILSAHCNEQGIARLLAAAKDDLVALDSGDSSQLVSGLVRTKFYSQTPSVLPLGSDHGSLSDSQRATSRVGFFNKECPFECTPDRNGAGASAQNGAVENIHGDNRDSAPEGTLWGVKAGDGINANRFHLFRDNTERTVRPDVWYPVSGSNGVTYKGEAPKTTLITRWAGGTPKLGTEFNGYAQTSAGKVALFDGEKKSQPQQMNFDAASGFSSATAAQIPGLVDEVTVQATWASEEGKPQVLQFAWEYAPTVASRVPSVLGFSHGGARALIGGYAVRETAVDGRCWAEFGTSAQKTRDLTKNTLNSRTGSDGVGEFLVESAGSSESRNLSLHFVRATKE